MTVYGFKSAKQARDLIKPPGHIVPGETWEPGAILLTPAEGIPARTNVPGFADCGVWAINESDELTEVIMNDGTPMTVKAYNVFAEEIPGNVYATAKRIYNKLVIDAAEC